MSNKGLSVLAALLALSALFLFFASSTNEKHTAALSPNGKAKLSSDAAGSVDRYIKQVAREPQASNNQQYNGPPTVRKVYVEQKYIDWADQFFGSDAFDPGYDDYEFIDIDTDYLLQQIRQTQQYVAAISNMEPQDPPDVSVPDFWLELFDYKIPLTITRLSLNSTPDLTFVNARGVITSTSTNELSSAPGPHSWTLSIEESLGIVTGKIRTNEFEIGIQYTRDRAETVAILASYEALSKFPPID